MAAAGLAVQSVRRGDAAHCVVRRVSAVGGFEGGAWVLERAVSALVVVIVAVVLVPGWGWWEVLRGRCAVEECMVADAELVKEMDRLAERGVDQVLC